MKKQNSSSKVLCFCFGLIVCFNCLRVWAEPQTNQNIIATNLLLASVRSGAQLEFETVAAQFIEDRDRLISSLQNILGDPNAPNFSRCGAAYYLGEMRAVKSVEDLAVNITLALDLTKLKLYHVPTLPTHPAADALEKIGSASIPSLVRRLGETDDPNISAALLKVVTRIDRDKDLTRLRLDKALAKEHDIAVVQRLRHSLANLEKLDGVK